MEVVLDSSVALAWALPDETSRRADRLLAEASGKSVFWVPALWWYEVANALTMAKRRGRLAEADRARTIGLYGMLPIQADSTLDVNAIWRFHTLAEDYALSAYDAAYLELALRRGLRIVTFDKRLISAARKTGVRVVRP
ncbi:MAG: type II toxin-antitoxin system VapC family toxin [bacterium]